MIKKIRTSLISSFGETVGFPISTLFAGLILFINFINRNSLSSRIMLGFSILIFIAGIAWLISLYKLKNKV
ncbi:hypothetical protein [Clostridium hydrogenum]|uniref:hypothetical protein n=1 Tax=Clostridium hydrogenum TaxID=2855764 RepID=UPI001F1F2A01|nr:hypothetical protein [Clostridium hydrogenum]